jgi:DNA-binding SARP family transcriptional activator
MMPHGVLTPGPTAAPDAPGRQRSPVLVRLLGPVEVLAGDRPVPLGPPQRRAVFAALAVDTNRPVSLQTLAARVWDEPPDAATDSLYAHITRLRRALAEVAVPIERRTAGYVLQADPDLIDLHRFHRLAKQAHHHPDQDDAGRGALLDEAIGLWRDAPLLDVPGDWAGRVRYGIEQEYVGAVVDWARAQLRLGRPAALIPHLTDLLRRYPVVEPLAGTLMRGLCALGRSTEALAHYARLRRYLAEQLGVEPGPELRALHEEILRGDHDRPPRKVAGPSRRARGTWTCCQPRRRRRCGGWQAT